jgi:hypothetical protein
VSAGWHLPEGMMMTMEFFKSTIDLDEDYAVNERQI